MMKKMNKKAFTLIELIVVIAVIGILVLLGVPRFIGHTQKAELARIQHDVKVMEQEIGTEFINGDDDFNSWGDNNKDFTQLIQEGKLFEKEGVAYEEPIDGPYKVIPEEYKDKINTKLKGTFYANSHGKVYYEHLKALSGIPTEPEEKEPGVPVDPEKPAEPVEEETVEKEPVYSDEEIEGLIEEGYIPIATPEDLDSIRSNTTRLYGKGTEWAKEYTGGLDKKYVQVANIDLSGDSEKGWTPIGTEFSEFEGTYDGGNYVITGLEVEGESYQGLFGRIQYATIRNVGLENVNITATGNYVGGLVGEAHNSTIENSYATGSVKSTWRNVGGLVGHAYRSTTISNSYTTVSVTGLGRVGGLAGYADRNTTISNSYATGSVTAKGNVGGLVGSVTSSTIDNSYATGPVEGSGSQVGGLVGQAWNNTEISNSSATGSVKGEGNVGGLVGFAQSGTMISNSYATGSVTGEEDVGGLVGEADTSTIENSYATGPVKGSRYVGGLVGYADKSTISNSYWDKQTTKQDSSRGGGEGKLTEDMKKQATYEGWNFDEVWKINDGDYPKLR